MTASTRRMWINPPIVYEVTIPRSHKTTRITAIVHNILCPPLSISYAEGPCALDTLVDTTLLIIALNWRTLILSHKPASTHIPDNVRVQTWTSVLFSSA